MNELLFGPLLLTAMFGGLLGIVFFGGLWWTVRKSLASTQPALWIFASLLLRLGLVLAGFYLLAGDQWQRWLACLSGFFVARLIVTRTIPALLNRSGAALAKQSKPSEMGKHHAPES